MRKPEITLRTLDSLRKHAPVFYSMEKEFECIDQLILVRARVTVCNHIVEVEGVDVVCSEPINPELSELLPKSQKHGHSVPVCHHRIATVPLVLEPFREPSHRSARQVFQLRQPIGHRGKVVPKGLFGKKTLYCWVTKSTYRKQPHPESSIPHASRIAQGLNSGRVKGQSHRPEISKSVPSAAKA